MLVKMDWRWPVRRLRTEPQRSEIWRQEAVPKEVESEVGPTSRSGQHSDLDGARSRYGSFD